MEPPSEWNFRTVLVGEFQTPEEAVRYLRATGMEEAGAWVLRMEPELRRYRVFRIVEEPR